MRRKPVASAVPATTCDLPSCRDADGCRAPYRGIVPQRRADDMPVRYMDAASPEERRRWFAWFDRWLARR